MSPSYVSVKLPNGKKMNINTTNGVFNVLNSNDSILSEESRSTRSTSSFRARFGYDNVAAPKSNIVKRIDDIMYESQPISNFPCDQTNPSEYSYECDEEDRVYIELVNQARQQEGKTLITMDVFALVLDKLEKQSYFQVEEISSEDGCSICNGGYTYEDDQIVYCSMCNLAVHQSCYGVPRVPAGDWLCRRCTFSPSSTAQCCFCPKKGGALKQTNTGEWMHLLCAQAHKELFFLNPSLLEPVVDVELVKDRGLDCMICRDQTGFPIQCCAAKCKISFHIICAQRAGMKLEDYDAKDTGQGKKRVRCLEHCDRKKEDRKSQEEIVVIIEQARQKIMEENEKTQPLFFPSISQGTIDELFSQFGDSVKDIVEYWSIKRQNKCGTRLLRTNRDVTIRGNLKARKQRRKWGIDLSEGIKKVEDYKKTLEMITSDDILEATISCLYEEDDCVVFTHPLDPSVCKGKVENPVCLEKMRTKLINKEYESIADIQSDFNLMMKNWVKYYKDHQTYSSYRIKYANKSMQIFYQFEELRNNFDTLRKNPNPKFNRLQEKALDKIIEKLEPSAVDTDSQDDKTPEIAENDKDKENVITTTRKYQKEVNEEEKEATGKNEKQTEKTRKKPIKRKSLKIESRLSSSSPDLFPTPPISAVPSPATSKSGSIVDDDEISETTSSADESYQESGITMTKRRRRLN